MYIYILVQFNNLHEFNMICIKEKCKFLNFSI